MQNLDISRSTINFTNIMGASNTIKHIITWFSLTFNLSNKQSANEYIIIMKKAIALPL
jgi:hypothetical protein